jgi:hypothetical protein
MDIKKYSFKQGLPGEFELIRIGQLYHEHTKTLTTPHQRVFITSSGFRRAVQNIWLTLIRLILNPTQYCFYLKIRFKDLTKTVNFK